LVFTIERDMLYTLRPYVVDGIEACPRGSGNHSDKCRRSD
jgi:hypothetical protein